MEKQQPHSSLRDQDSVARPGMTDIQNTETSQGILQSTVPGELINLQRELCEKDEVALSKTGSKYDDMEQLKDTKLISHPSLDTEGTSGALNSEGIQLVPSIQGSQVFTAPAAPPPSATICELAGSESFKNIPIPVEIPNDLSNKEEMQDIIDQKDEKYPDTLLLTIGGSETQLKNGEVEEELSSCKDFGGGGDRVKITFDPCDGLRIHRMVLSAVQELRMRRAVDSENEDKIQQLMVEKQETEEKYQESQSLTTELKTLMTEKVTQARKENQTAIQDLREAKAKLQSTYEQSEKEVKSLKDEIRALQLTKYTLEKKVREQERKAEVTSSTSDTHLTRLPDLEDKCNITMNRAKDLEAACTRLDKNVKEAVRVNTRLAYENSHKSCQVEQYRADVKRLNKLLTAANTENAYQPEQHQHEVSKLETKVAALEKQLEKEKETSRMLQKQLDHSRTEQQNLGQSLADAHAIISQQSDQASQVTEDLNKVTETLDRLEQDHDKLTQEYKDLKDAAQEEKVKLSEECDQLKGKVSEAEKSFEELSTRHQELKENHEQLEQLNSDWASKNVSLHDQIKGLKAELEKPKSDAVTQTSLESAEVESQTEKPTLSTTEVQTVWSSMVSVDGWAQTKFLATVATAAQTEASVTTDTSSQTQEEQSKFKVNQTSENASGSETLQPDVQVMDKGLGVTEKVEAKEGQPSPKQQLPVVTIVQESPEQKEILETKSESEVSPYQKFSASLRPLRSQQSKTSTEDGAGVEQAQNRRPERYNRLKRRSTETAFADSTTAIKCPLDEKLGDSEAQPSPKSPRTERFSFQFLHIPELEKEVATGDSSTPAMKKEEKGEEKTDLEGRTGEGEGEVEGAKEMQSDTADIVVIPATPNVPHQPTEESIVVDVPPSPPAPPSILSGPKDSKTKVKQPKKVHFAECTELDDADCNSDSDALFSGDEENEVIELRNSQVSRIEHILLDGGSQV